MSAEALDAMLDLRTVAKVLGVCVRTVQRLVAGGDLPKPVKVGRSSRLFVSDVETYLKRLREQRGE